MENNQKKWYVDRYLYLCMTVCFGIALISIGYFIYRGNGIFTVRDDFNVQQIPFSIAVNDAVKNRQWGWMWNVDLGTNIIGAFSFYNLGSPFFWCSVLFPAEWFPYVVGWLYILKYVVAGMTAYLYIRRFINNREWAVLGAVLYAFSGFQTTNLMFYHFHDVVAFFPLLLLAFETLIVNQRRGGLALAVGINCLVNYYFFCGEIIFLVIYFICRIGIHKTAIKTVILCCVEGILGIGMAGFMFIPSVLFIRTNPKASFDMLSIDHIFYSFAQYLKILAGILLPAEPMHSQSFITSSDYSSTAAYLPGVGLVLVIAYVVRERGWIRRLLVTSVVISLSPILNCVYTGFSQDYRRWWYMPILIMALASAIVLDHYENYKIKISSIINLSLVITFATIVSYYVKQEKFSLYSRNTFAGLVAWAVGSCIVIWLLSYSVRMFRIGIWGMVILTSILTTSITLHLYRTDEVTSEEWKHKWQLDRQLVNYDINYRYDADNSASYIGGVHPLRTFNSTITGSIFEMHRAFELSRSPAWLSYDVDGVAALMAGKYYFVNQPEKDDEIIQSLDYDSGTRYLIGRKACPIGFTYDTYISQSDFRQIERENRGYAALKSLVVNEQYQQEVAQYLDEVDINTIHGEDMKYDIEKNQNNIVNIYEMNSKGFKAQATRENVTYAFFSVPYDEGWKAYLNGSKISIMKVNGMMAIQLKSGENNICFRYHIPGFHIGIVISIFSVLIFVIYKGHRIKFLDNFARV